MVDSVEDIKKFIQSDRYSGLAEKIVERTRKTLCADLHDAEVEYCQKLLGAATISLSDLDALLAGDAENLERFCVQLIRADRQLNGGQDFNICEPEEWEEENEVYAGHSKTFLFTFAVLYIVLRDRRSDLFAYLRAIRQPKTVEYQRGVEFIFDALWIE